MLEAGSCQIRLPTASQRFGITALPTYRGRTDPLFAIDSPMSWLVWNEDLALLMIRFSPFYAVFESGWLALGKCRSRAVRRASRLDALAGSRLQWNPTWEWSGGEVSRNGRSASGRAACTQVDSLRQSPSLIRPVRPTPENP